MTSSISSSLYWGLPTPSGFVRRISADARNYRATVLSFPRQVMPGTWDAVREGLQQADIRKVIELTIRDGMDVATEVGPHFGAGFLTAAELAGTKAKDTTAVLLRPKGDQAREKCDEYCVRFISEIENSVGNTHLIVETRAGEQRIDGSGDDVRVIAFDGALSLDEMSAYVGLRMLGRTGPGSTRLLRSLVYEYAGFDASLAEQLIEFSDSDILGLPETLGTLIETDPLRWSGESWTDGTTIDAGGTPTRHPLYEWHLALHRGPRQDEALLAAKKRYWQACVRALIPWLEERRLRVLEMLRQPLDTLLAPTSGKLPKALPNGTVILIDRSDVEYSNVVGLHYHEGLVIPNDVQSQQALAVCKVAKSVRDALAHLRAPKTQDVLSLISTMDSLLR